MTVYEETLLIIKPSWNVDWGLEIRSVGLFGKIKNGITFGPMDPIRATIFPQRPNSTWNRDKLTGLQDDRDECFDEPALYLAMKVI